MVPTGACATQDVSSLESPSFTPNVRVRSEEHTSELQSQSNLVCRLLLEKKNLRIQRAENGGLCTSRHANAAACRSAATPRRTPSRTRRVHVRFVRSQMRKSPRSADSTPD